MQQFIFFLRHGRAAAAAGEMAHAAYQRHYANTCGANHSRQERAGCSDMDILEALG